MRHIVKTVPYILRLALCFAVMLQLGRADPVHADATDYICNPGGQPPSIETIAQIRELFEAAGKTLPEDDASSDHCQDCITPPLLAVMQVQTVSMTDWPSRDIPIWWVNENALNTPRGPPLGGRAPPFLD